jgi:hypothetical protein
MVDTTSSAGTPLAYSEASAAGDHSLAHEALQEFFAAQEAKRNQTPVLSVCLLFIVVAFLYTTYHTIQENFALERVQEEGQRAAENLIEEATPMFVAVLRETAPVYREEAERALRETAPKLAERTRSELKLGMDEVTEKAHLAIQSAASDYLATILQESGGQLPEGFDWMLTHEAQAECKALMTAELEELFVELDQQFRPPTERLIDALDELADDQEHADYEELKRRFVHLWLVLLDSEVTEGTSLEPLELGLGSGTQ